MCSLSILVSYRYLFWYRIPSIPRYFLNKYLVPREKVYMDPIYELPRKFIYGSYILGIYGPYMSHIWIPYIVHIWGIYVPYMASLHIWLLSSHIRPIYVVVFIYDSITMSSLSYLLLGTHIRRIYVFTVSIYDSVPNISPL